MHPVSRACLVRVGLCGVRQALQGVSDLGAALLQLLAERLLLVRGRVLLCLKLGSCLLAVGAGRRPHALQQLAGLLHGQR